MHACLGLTTPRPVDLKRPRSRVPGLGGGGTTRKPIPVPTFHAVRTHCALFLILFVLLLYILAIINVDRLITPGLHRARRRITLGHVTRITRRVRNRLGGIRTRRHDVARAVPLLSDTTVSAILPNLISRCNRLGIFNNKV